MCPLLSEKARKPCPRANLSRARVCTKPASLKGILRGVMAVFLFVLAFYPPLKDLVGCVPASLALMLGDLTRALDLGISTNHRPLMLIILRSPKNQSGGYLGNAGCVAGIVNQHGSTVFLSVPCCSVPGNRSGGLFLRCRQSASK